MAVRKFIDLVFEGPPDHDAPRFIEAEDESGRSVKVGDWVQRIDGLWALRLRSDDFAAKDSSDDLPATTP